MNLRQDHPQIVKELRALALPWAGAVLAGSLVGLLPLSTGEAFESLLLLLVVYGFLGGLALVATLSFGQELQDRTISLLLVQPISRSRLWNQKLLLASAAIIAAVLLELGLLAGISTWYPGDELWEAVRMNFPREELFLAGVFLLAAVCSSGFWTLFTGSIIGGLVFTVASQLLCALAVALAWARFRGFDFPFQAPLTFVVLSAAGLVYSGIFLWLGWRKFAGLELKSLRIGEGFKPTNRLVLMLPWNGLLVCRPTGRLSNLVRKELRLQKINLQLAAAFILCWVAVVLLQRVRPSQNFTFLFDVLTCLFAPVSSLLVGCISLGEEKSLGLTAAQLTLPFSSWRQWAIKLSVSGVTAAILSLGLPLLLFRLSTPFVELQNSGLMNPRDNGMAALAIISGFMFLLGYWAIGLTSNTVRAALLAIVAIIALPSLAMLGVYWGYVAFGVAALGPRAGQIQFGLRDAAIAGAVLAVIQSLARFRRSEERRSKLLLYFGTLAGVVVFVGFWATCYG